MSDVEYRPWPHDERYLIGEDGTIVGPGRWSPGLLSPYVHPGDPRPRVSMGKGNVKRVCVVCETWHGPRPSPAHQAAHGNGDETDNRATNLRWATPVENRADTYLHGTHLEGEASPVAVLTEDAVRAIRRAWAAGTTARSIAAQHGISDRNVGHIVHGRSWAHLDVQENERAAPRDRATYMKRGEQSWRTSLTEGDVRAIRAAAAAGETFASIAARYGCTRPNIGHIVNRKTWRHVA